jgi:hypothetical protein
MIDFGGKPKLVEKINSTIAGVGKYYVPFNELFHMIYAAHVTINKL